jgi:hypothetical protein
MFKINLIKVHDISLHLTLYMLNSQIVKYIKGSTVHIAPACVGSREGSITLKQETSMPFA